MGIVSRGVLATAPAGVDLVFFFTTFSKIHVLYICLFEFIRNYYTRSSV